MRDYGECDGGTHPIRAILNQDRLEDEITVAWNGEDEFHCDPIVQEALETYWSKSKRLEDRSGHFVRRSGDVRSYVVSKVVDMKKNRPPKLSIMMESK